MTINELRVNLDLNIGNPMSILIKANAKSILIKANAKERSISYLFVDSDDGQCYLFDEDGKEKDIYSLTEISDKLFLGDTALTKIVLPNSVTNIGYDAFCNCTSLTYVMIPDSVTSIGDWAFYRCSELTNVTIGNGVKSIGHGAFLDCKSLMNVTIGAGVKSINYCAFNCYNSLKSLVFKGKTTTEVKQMKNYPFGIDKSIIKCEALGLTKALKFDIIAIANQTKGETAMTIDEANSKVKELSKLNLCIWDASTSSEKEELRNKFREIYKDVQEAGFKVIRGKEYDPVRGYRIPKFKIHNDHSEELVNIIDNRGEGNHHGDCTTRCISFCTGVDYETIQKEQMRNANEAKAHGCYVTWRTCRVWSQSLTSRGFTELFLPKHVSAKVFISKFKDSGIDDGIIAARSSGHVAAIDMKTKKILDTWNSAGKRIKSIFVPISQKCMWMDKLEKILNK